MKKYKICNMIRKMLIAFANVNDNTTTIMKLVSLDFDKKVDREYFKCYIEGLLEACSDATKELEEI